MDGRESGRRAPQNENACSAKKKHGRYVSASACVLERAYVGMCSGEGVKKKRWQAEGAASMGAATVGCARDALYVHVDPAVESSEG